MRLYLVRHGETTDNYNRIHQGHRNSPLTDLGQDQAKLVGERLKHEKFDIAFSSDLDRTIHTASEILKFHPHLKLIKKRELREQGKGIYEGKPHGTMNKAIEKSGIIYHKFKPVGGESFNEIWDNMINFYNEIKVKYKSKNVLIIGHGGPILCLITYLHNKGIEGCIKFIPIKNTSVTIVDIIDNNSPKFTILNCTKHLEK